MKRPQAGRYRARFSSKIKYITGDQHFNLYSILYLEPCRYVRDIDKVKCSGIEYRSDRNRYFILIRKHDICGKCGR